MSDTLKKAPLEGFIKFRASGIQGVSVSRFRVRGCRVIGLFRFQGFGFGLLGFQGLGFWV